MGVTEHTQDATVYTDPRAPGAPQVGDVVVVVCGWTPGHPSWKDGTVDRLASTEPWDPQPWVLTPYQMRAHSVRRPTEAEVTQWYLTHGCEDPHAASY